MLRTGWFWLALFMATFTLAVSGWVYTTHELRRADCRQAHEVRAEQEQLWLALVDDFEAGPSARAMVSRRYDQLPDPPTC